MGFEKSGLGLSIDPLHRTCESIPVWLAAAHPRITWTVEQGSING
jgi:hypothetical protein